jgi:hypothetical protein
MRRDEKEKRERRERREREEGRGREINSISQVGTHTLSAGLAASRSIHPFRLELKSLS